MTLKLYLEDSYLTEFEAEALELIDGDKIGLVLNRTAFYPSAGGQACDLGTINGIAVVDVQKDGNDRIIHYLESNSISVDDKVTGQIDWDRRSEYMRKHTGQHILSRAFIETFDTDTVGAHLGEFESSIELNNENLTIAQLDRAEEVANRIVLEDRKIYHKMVPTAELRNYNLRKIPDRDGIFRLVFIDDFDTNACGGTHLKSTGGVGLIKIIGQEKIRGHLRISFLAGLSAYKDYCGKHDAITELSKSMTCHYGDIKAGIDKLIAQNSDNRKEIARLGRELLPIEIAKLVESAEIVEDVKIVSGIYEGRDLKELQTLAGELKKKKRLVCIFSDGSKLLIASADDVNIHCGNAVKSLIEKTGGRGGGNKAIAQLGSLESNDIKEVVKAALEVVKIYLEDD